MRRAVTAVVVLSLVAGFGWWLGQRRPEPPRLQAGSECRVGTDEQVRLEREQLAHAATIVAVGVRLGMPDRAMVVALATALQESKLRNLPHLGAANDHDSIGLFQQRPSQGWGAVEQLNDPRYAAEQFYLALQNVHGWQQLRVTDAAQQVQRSAFPEAYQQWESDAQVLATALLGHQPAGVVCRAAAADQPTTPEQLGSALTNDWGEQIQYAPADPPGLTVSAPDGPSGWRYAHWLVAHAEDYGVTRVQFADQEWTATTGTWSTTGSVIDHVRAEVATG
jgi:hypothetical protein